QLRLHRIGVRHRIDAALDMGDVVILEATQDVDDRIDLADIGEELVAETFALGRTPDETGDVDKGNAGRDDFLGAGDLRDVSQARVRNSNLAGIRLYGAE